MTIYGAFDLLRIWEECQLTRPRDQTTEIILGGSQMEIRDAFYEASPLSWTMIRSNQGPSRNRNQRTARR